uniref:sulfotransferase family protein n=1 Tax=Thaumasiovibrio occultus TaxID=1891184 RepID=UPI000B35716E|nr:sulfotransferase [Thaumasiovibrio occultus]
MTPNNFAFIVGAQKSGTTSLARALNDNPAICLSHPKESDYFSGNYHKGEDWYLSLFDASPSQIRLDASTSYAQRPLSKEAIDVCTNRVAFNGVPERIYQFCPTARIIYLVREPALRTYSHYWHNTKYGREHRHFQQALEHDCFYTEVSQYYQQILPYYELFSPEQILIVRFEDLICQQQEVIAQCERHLGVPAFDRQTLRNENKSFQYNRFGQMLISNPLTKNLDRLLPNQMTQGLKRWLKKTPPALPHQERLALNQRFAEDNSLFKQLTGTAYWQE